MAPAVATLRDDERAVLGDGGQRVAPLPGQRGQPVALRARGPGPPAGRPAGARRADWRASPTRPTVHTPSAESFWRAVGTPATRAMGRYSMAPAATLATVGDRWADRCLGSTTPVTPAHSALRSSAPRLWGSVMPSRTSRNGSRPRRVGCAQRLERRLLDRPGQGHHPLGGRRCGPRESIRRRDTYSTRTRRAGGQRLDLVEDGGGVHALGHQQRPHRPPVGAQQLPDGLAPLDLVAAQPGGSDRCGAGPCPVVPAGPASVAAGRRPAAGRPPVPRPTAGRPAPPLGPERPGGRPDRRHRRRPGATAAGRRHCGPRPRPRPPPSAGLIDRSRRGPARRRRRQQDHGGAGDALGPAQGPQPLGPGGLDVDRGPEHAQPAARPSGPRRGPAGPLGHHRAVGVDRRPSRPRPTSSTTPARMARLSAPAHAGSVSGACRPRSPRPAAPSRASAMAWATASASL